MKEIDYTKLIQTIQSQNLHSIEFKKESIVIKKQVGNNSGSKFEIEFDDTKRIGSIIFTKGGYNEPISIKKELDELFDIVINA